MVVVAIQDFLMEDSDYGGSDHPSLHNPDSDHRAQDSTDCNRIDIFEQSIMNFLIDLFIYSATDSRVTEPNPVCYAANAVSKSK